MELYDPVAQRNAAEEKGDVLPKSALTPGKEEGQETDERRPSIKEEKGDMTIAENTFATTVDAHKAASSAAVLQLLERCSLGCGRPQPPAARWVERDLQWDDLHRARPRRRVRVGQGGPPGRSRGLAGTLRLG